MDFSNKIIVIGDSHVRAFSFNRNFVPLFIGPAAFNNFLTEEAAERLKNKIREFFDKSRDHRFSIMLLFSGDVEHSVRKSADFNAERITELERCAHRYTKVLAYLAKEFPNLRISVSAVLPGMKSEYVKVQNAYNSVLRTYCESVNLDFIDINEPITDDRALLKYPFRGDFAHVNYEIVPFYVNELIRRGLLGRHDWSLQNDYRWAYITDIDTTLGPFKIWGNVYKDQFTIKEHEKLPLSELLEYSAGIADITKKIGDLCTSVFKENKFTVANCAEGFLAFEIVKHFEVSVSAFDFDNACIENAHLLNRIVNKDDRVEFVTAEVDDMRFNLNPVLIDFEQYKYKEEVRKNLLDLYHKKVKYLFMLSTNVKSDIRMLKKAGYNNSVVYYALESSNKSIILSAQDESVNLRAYDFMQQGINAPPNEVYYLKLAIKHFYRRFKKKMD